MTKVSLNLTLMRHSPCQGLAQKRLIQEDTDNYRGSTVDPTNRLRIATRIHFALLRHFGEDVAVAALLDSESATREAIWVCEGSGDAELVALARQFEQANQLAAHDGAVATQAAVTSDDHAAPQHAAWSHNSTGFGVSALADLGEAPESGSTLASWLNAANWLRRNSSKTQH